MLSERFGGRVLGLKIKLKKAIQNGAIRKVIAVSVIFVLACSDFVALQNTFAEMNLIARMEKDALIMQIILAICLEGLPAILGHTMGKATERAKSDKNASHTAWVGFIFALLGTVLVLGITLCLRGLPVMQKVILENAYIREANEVPDAIAKKSLAVYWIGGYDELPLNILQAFYPILTSIFSFAISWMMLGSSNEQDVMKRAELAEEVYRYEIRRFQLALSRLQDARMELWSLVANSQNLPEIFRENYDATREEDVKKSIPYRQDVFKRLCTSRIINKVIIICLRSYPEQVYRYNTEVEAVLVKAITAMKKYTTTPELIESITLESIIKRYNDLNSESGKKWDTTPQDEEKEVLKKDMESLYAYLNNNVQIQWCRSDSIPYPRGGEQLK